MKVCTVVSENPFIRTLFLFSNLSIHSKYRAFPHLEFGRECACEDVPFVSQIFVWEEFVLVLLKNIFGHVQQSCKNGKYVFRKPQILKYLVGDDGTSLILLNSRLLTQANSTMERKIYPIHPNINRSNPFTYDTYNNRSYRNLYLKSTYLRQTLGDVTVLQSESHQWRNAKSHPKNW